MEKKVWEEAAAKDADAERSKSHQANASELSGALAGSAGTAAVILFSLFSLNMFLIVSASPTPPPLCPAPSCVDGPAAARCPVPCPLAGTRRRRVLPCAQRKH